MNGKDCEFCRLVKREEAVSCVYEDERTMAFLDVRPASEGHTLVIPKAHYETIYDIPEDEIAYLFRIVKRIAWAVKKAVKAQGISVTQHNEKAALQRIFHFHVHVIPRYEGDKLARHLKFSEVNRNRLNETAERIRAYL
jgi:histidine triad (HIT) family protein